ncbi:MAG: cell division protein ZapA [Burkholderiales bacterium PBB5]|nr:MAG: cell division protein ZapA [Burkholderiales bacterium PBB5]
MPSPKQIEATILGQSYVLACPPGGEALLLEAVNIVDREMSAIRDAGKVKARERMAVLTALNLAYQRAEADAKPAAPVPVAAPVVATFDDGSIDLEALIRRVDTALDNDGHLL